MQIIKISAQEVEKLFAQTEGHFLDFKSIAIAPGKLTKGISAFANSDGGEVLLGLVEPSRGGAKVWEGFQSVEAANSHIQAIESVLPLGQGYRLTFLEADGKSGLVLQIEVHKNREIIKATSGEVYVRSWRSNVAGDIF